MKITTKTGFTCEIDEDIRDDAELFEALIAMEKGEHSAYTDASQRLLGKTNKARLYEHCRGDNGRVSLVRVMEEIREIIAEVDALKNDVPRSHGVGGRGCSNL